MRRGFIIYFRNIYRHLIIELRMAPGVHSLLRALNVTVIKGPRSFLFPPERTAVTERREVISILSRVSVSLFFARYPSPDSFPLNP